MNLSSLGDVFVFCQSVPSFDNEHPPSIQGIPFSVNKNRYLTKETAALLGDGKMHLGVTANEINVADAHRGNHEGDRFEHSVVLLPAKEVAWRHPLDTRERIE